MSDDSPLPPVQHLGFCRYCGRTVHDRSFSQPSAEAEYDRWVACAPCHDTLGLAPDVREGVSDRTVVLHGVVFAAALVGSQVLEVVLLPFQYAPWHGRFEFEPADIVRAGAWLAPLDPLVELAAVRAAWDRRRERVLIVDSLDDPVLRIRTVHNHMIVALDGASAAAAEQLNPGIRRPPLVDLSTAVDWAEAFGAPLEALVRARVAPEPARCLPPLRQAALVARLLELHAPHGPRQGRHVLEHVLCNLAPPPEVLATEGSRDAPH